MSEVKWVKIYVDMFDNKKIKRIRKLPEGNNILLIWIMLLTQAGTCNTGGFIYFLENIPYNTKDLAAELDFSADTVELALQVFQKFNMIDIDEKGFINILNWEEYQNTTKMESLKEYNRLAKQKEREKKKEKQKLLGCFNNDDINNQNNENNIDNQNDGQEHVNDMSLTCQEIVIDCQCTDIDLDLALEKEKEYSNNPTPPVAKKTDEAAEEFLKFSSLLLQHPEYPYSEQMDKMLYKVLKEKYSEADILKRMAEWLEINRLNMSDKTRPRIIKFFAKPSPQINQKSEEVERLRQLLNGCSYLTDRSFAESELSNYGFKGVLNDEQKRILAEIQYVHKFKPERFGILKRIYASQKAKKALDELIQQVAKDFEKIRQKA